MKEYVVVTSVIDEPVMSIIYNDTTLNYSFVNKLLHCENEHLRDQIYDEIYRLNVLVKKIGHYSIKFDDCRVEVEIKQIDATLKLNKFIVHKMCKTKELRVK